jgi:L-iditol 2-dehydrogenase
MKAVVKVKEGKGNIELREMPEPTPGPMEVRVRVTAAGICGSDIHIWDSDIQIPMKPPVIVGHEFSGIIDQVGSGVETYKPGDRVTSETAAIVCGTCRFCRSGNYNLCHHRRGIGYWVNGAFARYCVVPVRRLHRLPDNVDLISAALCEPLACCVHGVNELTNIAAGDVVVLTGPGPIGLLAMQCAKAEGGYLIVCGTSADKARLDLAQQLGADRVVDIQQEDIKTIVGELTGGLGADVVLECSGAAAAASFGLDIVCKGGKYTQIGLFGRPIQIDFEKIAYKEITVKGSFSQKWTAWTKALQFLQQGKVITKPIISDVLPLDLWQEGFEKHRNKTGLKIVLKPE